MIRIILSSFLCFLLQHAAYGQSWAPYGASWTYTYVNNGTYPGPVPDYPSTWIADTATFHGHLCSFLHHEKLALSGPIDIYASRLFDVVVTYEVDDKVYWYIPETDTFTMLYDFTKKAGESWKMNGLTEMGDPSGPLCNAIVRVVSTGMDTINGIPLKSMVIEGDGYPIPYKAIQHIGSLLQPRPSPMFLCMTISDYIEYSGLRCIDIPGIGFHDFKKVPYCNYVTGIKESEQTADFTISPNPCNELVSFTYNGTSAGVLEIHDMIGRLILSHPVSALEKNYPIATGGWAPGIYLYSLKLEGAAIQTGKLFRN